MRSAKKPNFASWLVSQIQVNPQAAAFWRDALRLNYAEYLRTAHWQKKRRAILKRDGNRCTACRSDEELQVHHKDYARLGCEADSDLTTLCRRCHAKLHGKA